VPSARLLSRVAPAAAELHWKANLSRRASAKGSETPASQLMGQTPLERDIPAAARLGRLDRSEGPTSKVTQTSTSPTATWRSTAWPKQAKNACSCCRCSASTSASRIGRPGRDSDGGGAKLSGKLIRSPCPPTGRKRQARSSATIQLTSSGGASPAIPARSTRPSAAISSEISNVSEAPSMGTAR
jgi:hypothetical protein